MKFLSAILAFMMLGGFSLGTSWGQCTQEEMQAKARRVAEKLEQLHKRNDEEYRFMLLRFNNRAQLLDENDIQAWCDFYDQVLLEL